MQSFTQVALMQTRELLEEAIEQVKGLSYLDRSYFHYTVKESGSKSKNRYTKKEDTTMKSRRMTPFGKYVVKTLTDRDMSKTELATAVGTSPQYLNYILYGKRSGEKYLTRIIAVLGLDPQKVERLTA